MAFRNLKLENGEPCAVWDTVLDLAPDAGSGSRGTGLLTFRAGREERWLSAAPTDWATLPDAELCALWKKAEPAWVLRREGSRTVLTRHAPPLPGRGPARM